MSETGSVDGGARPFGGPSVLEFHGKMHRISKFLVYGHAIFCAFGAISYTIVSILGTAGWETEAPGALCPIMGGITVNLVLINLLAVGVNLSLCLAALLVIGFNRCRLLFVKIWFWGQLGIEALVTVLLVIAVVLSCKTAAILSIPPFLYLVASLSCYRQISAAVSYQNQYCLK